MSPAQSQPPSGSLVVYGRIRYMKKYFRKKIPVNKEGNYVWAYLFKDVTDMREYYKKISPEDASHDEVDGVCVNGEGYRIGKNGKMTLKNKIKETGRVLTCTKYAGAGVVAHELMHAILFADGISKVLYKEQYPITIKGMEDEERLLYALTGAVRTYYNWYYKLQDKGLI